MSVYEARDLWPLFADQQAKGNTYLARAATASGIPCKGSGDRFQFSPRMAAACLAVSDLLGQGKYRPTPTARELYRLVLDADSGWVTFSIETIRGGRRLGDPVWSAELADALTFRAGLPFAAVEPSIYHDRVAAHLAAANDPPAGMTPPCVSPVPVGGPFGVTRPGT